jgi:hypothetical protein
MNDSATGSPLAHNRLVAGSSPAGPTKQNRHLANRRRPRKRADVRGMCAIRVCLRKSRRAACVRCSRRTLKGCDWKGLLELIEEVRARVSRETGRAVEVISCYEAGYDGFWLHRQLEAHGIRNYVIDPASLQVDRRARRVKTDRIDAERLLRSLMAYLRSGLHVWP